MTSISMTEEAAVTTLKIDGMLAAVVGEFVPASWAPRGSVKPSKLNWPR